jgi:sugar lactone lactonase YvrE
MPTVQTHGAPLRRNAVIAAAAAITDATISQVAGSGVLGYMGDGGPATFAQLDGPTGVAVDAAGGIFVVDASNRVRHIAFGTISTIAGSGAPGFGGDGGPSTDAMLNDPIGVAVDATGGILIADQLNHRIRRVSPDGTITTLAGGGPEPPWVDGVPGASATLKDPDGVAADNAGNVFIADTGNHVIRRVDREGTITTVAGIGGASGGFAGDGGPATRARLNHPTGVTVGRKGELYIADEFNHRIRRVGPHGRISTVAGIGLPLFTGDGGPATEAALSFPTEVLIDGAQNLLIADSTNFRVRSVDRDGVITTIAGGGSEPPADGLPATSVRLNGPTGMALDAAGNLLVCEELGHRVWRLTP